MAKAIEQICTKTIREIRAQMEISMDIEKEAHSNM